MNSILSYFRILFIPLLIFMAGSVRAEDDKPVLHVRVDAQGEVTVSDHKASLAQLSEAVAAFLKDHPGAPVEIGAAKNIPLDKLAKVYEACRRVGASKFTIPKK